MDELATLSEINIYPIKSLAGIKLQRAFITPYGIAHPDNHDIIDRSLNNLNKKI